MASQDVLPECSQGFQDVRMAVAIIERDIAHQAKVADKLSEAVEKIQEMNQNLCKIIALHELRHVSMEKGHEEMGTDIREVHGRIDKMLTVDKLHPNKASKQDDLDTALAEFKKWKYIMTGAAVVIGYLLAHLNWTLLAGLLNLHGQ